GPAQVVSLFYDWYITYQGNPLTTQAYRSSPYLTAALVQKVDSTLALATPGAGGDPFICAQNPPSGFTTGTPSIQGDRATVTVHPQYEGNSRADALTVSLVQSNGEWKIDKVTCPQGK